MSNIFKEEFVGYMKANDIKYREIAENTIKISYSGDNLKSIPINVRFDADGDNDVRLDCYEIASFKEETTMKGVITCNGLNKKFRWVKFYLDDDHDVVVEVDTYVRRGIVGEELIRLVRHMVSIIDKSYPIIMKILWD